MEGPKGAMINLLLERVSRKKAQFDAGDIDYSQYRSEVRRVVSDARSMGLTRMMIFSILGGEL